MKPAIVIALTTENTTRLLSWTRNLVLVLLTAVILGCGGKQAPDVWFTAPVCSMPNKVWVQYATGSDRDALATSSAQNVANYTVAGQTVSSAKLYSSDQAVVLTLSGTLTAGTSTNVSASNVQDTAGRTQSPGTVTLPINYNATSQGAVAQYFSNKTLSGSPALTRVDSTIDFDVGTGSIGGVATDNVSIRWYTFADVTAAGDYRLQTRTDDGVRLWAFDIGGSKQIDQWYDMGASTFTTTDTFTASSSDVGKRIPVVMEYYENGGNAQAHLYWDTPSTSGYQIIPSSHLFTCVAAPAAEQLSSLGISVPATASTCSSASITITAKDGSGATQTSYVGTITLSTTSGHGDWALTTGSGTLTNGTADDGAATYTFAASDRGVVTLALSDKRADTLKVGASDASASVTAQSGNIVYSENAFEIAANDTFNSDVIAGRNHTFTLQYVRRPPSGATCQVDTGYVGSKNLKMWRTATANDASGTAPTVSSGAASVTLPASQPASNNFTGVNFTAGQATLTLSTSDVGQFSLNVRDDSSGYAVDTGGAAVPVTGSSSTYTVRPFGLRTVVTSTTGAANPGVSTATGSTFVIAGTPFNITVTGVAYQAADDTGTPDGIPDGHNDTDLNTGANLNDNAVLSHFGSEPVAVRPAVSFSSSLVAPAGGSNPCLVDPSTSNCTSTLASFSSGAGTAQRRFDDVGSIEIYATASNYLGSGKTLYGASGAVGRFIPSYFDVADLQQPSLANGHGNCSFTYQGETVAYSQSPGIQITAKNALGNKTNNYGGSYWRLSLPTASALSAAIANLPSGATTSLTRNTGSSVYTWSGTNDYDGTGTLYLSGDTYTFNKSASTGPVAADAAFTPKLKLTLPVSALSDPDSACYKTSSGGACASYVIDGADNSGFSGTELRYGRLRLSNAYGTTQVTLLMPATVEYWKTVGSNQTWITNTEENSACTGISLSNSDITLGNYQGSLSSGEVTSSFSGISAGGTGVINLGVSSSADPATVTGTVGVTVNVPVSLRYTQTGTGLANPSATATFGVYGGRAPIFNIQEGYR